MEQCSLKELRIELTRKCNLHCRDCYNNQFQNWREGLSVREISDLIETAMPLGLEIISLTGGEPLLDPDKLKEVVKYAKARGLETGLLTNGTLVDEKVVGELRDLGLDWARLSLDGSTRGVNALTRGDSFDSALEGIRRFAKSGIYSVLRTTVHKGNSDDILNMIALALSMSIPRLEFQPYVMLNKKELNNKFCLPAETQEKLATELLKAKRRYKGVLDIGLLSGWFEFLSPEYVRGAAAEEKCFCPHSDKPDVYSLHINAIGEIKTCGCNTFSLGNIRKDSIVDVFLNSPYLQDLRNYDASKYCTKCPSPDLCFPCPAPRTNIYGTVNAADPNCPKVKKGENK